MNKVFKVIWSDARSAYVVVSEMAKSHGTKSCSTKKLLAMLIATGVMTCASVAPVIAANNPAPTDTRIEVGSGASAKGAEGVAIGKNSEASASGYATAIGGDAKATGNKSVVVGNWSTASGAASVTVGHHSVSSGTNAISIGLEAEAAGDNSFAFGNKANARGESSVAFGNGSKATHLIAIAIGSGAEATEEETIAIGGSAKATGLYSVAIGNHIDETGEKAVAIGQQTKAHGMHATAVGAESQAQYKGATAVGTFSKAIKEGSIALGYNSYADREAGVKGYDPLTGKESTSTSLAWKSGKGALSIGSAGGARQIINVAAGSQDTDAVNVAQLKKVGELAEKGWQLSANGGKATKVAPGAKVDFSGDQNVSISKDAKDGVNTVKVELNKDLTGIETISNDGASLTLNGTATELTNGKGAAITLFGDTTTINGKVNVYKDGRIAGVADGVNANDAVNVSQLQKAAAASATTVSDGVNTTVTATKAKDGHTDYKVNLNKDLVGIESISNGDAKLTLGGFATELANGQGASVKLFGDTTTINNAVTVYKDGRIAGVADGINNNDAVNVGQLKNSAWKLAANGVLTEAEDVKAGDYVDFSGDQNVSVSKDVKDGVKTVKVELNKDLIGIESISNDGAKLTLNGTATELTNGKGAAITLFGDTTTINNKVTVYKDGRISGVAAGIRDTDAVNVSQLKAVGTTANMGWNLATNGVATEATNVKPGDFVDFSGDKNISVSHDGTKVKVELNKDIDVNSVQTNALNAKYNLSVGTANENGIMPFFVNSNGAFYGANNNFSVDKDGKVIATAGEIGNVVLQNGVYTGHSALRDAELFVGDADGNYSQITPKSAKLGQVTIDEKGNMAGVNSIQTNALNAKYNLSVGTANENGIMPFFVNSNGAFYGANNNFSVDKDGKVIATAGEIGNVVLQNGVYTGHSALRDGELFVGDASGNYSQITTKGAKLGKVTVAADGKISGVAAGAVTADSTDAVNGSQLHAVATEAGKHSKVVSGNNINVEETDVDGQKFYKVNMNKDIMLGDLTGKNVSISGTNGTIEATGAIATKDRVYADKGAKLADIDVTGNKISNGASSIVLDGSNVKVNDKVTIDQNGKISGVAKGEVSKNSTDAINGSQLNQTNENVAALDKRVTQNEADIAQNKADIAQNKADIAQNKADIAQNKADIVQNKTDIKNLDNRVTNVEELAKKHTTVTEGDNIAVTESTNKDGGKEYKVALDKDINLDSVTTGQTVMNNDGLKVGKDVSVTATAVTAGKTSISDEGVKVGDKTYISDKGLNANDQKVTNVAAGELSATSKDAVNGSQLYETNQAIANNATNISSLSHSISNLDNRVNKVGAGAAALAALHPLDFDPDAKWDFAAGYGNYRGANAAAVGAYYRPNEDTMFSVGGTFGNGENMVNAGVSFKLGSGSSHVSTSRVAMAKEIKELRGELEAMKSAMLDANAGKKIDTSKLQLFPDVPQNHWAYEYVAQLAGNGMIEGYPDGNFAGDRPMTRYEFAAILYRAMMKGAVLSDKILSEFSHELEYFTVDTIAKDKAGNPTIQRVRTVKENKNK